MSDLEEANRLLGEVLVLANSKPEGLRERHVELIRHNIKDARSLLENMKEKTCTLTWREDGTALADCSNCGEGQLYDDYNYCPNCGAKNIDPEGKTSDPPGIQRCPKCNEPYNPKPGVFMIKCIACGSDMMENASEVENGPEIFHGGVTFEKPHMLDEFVPKVIKSKSKEKCECYLGSLLGAGWPRCPYCGGEMPSTFIPEGAVYVDTDSILMLFCNECNKIIRNPVWDEETHNPYCPDCKNTVVERSLDKEGGST